MKHNSQIDGLAKSPTLIKNSMLADIEKIMDDVNRFYGSCDVPNYSGVEELNGHPDSIIAEEFERNGYRITNQTDYNYDRSFDLALTKNSTIYLVRLSIVTNCAILFDLDCKNIEKLILPEKLAEPNDIADIVMKAGFVFPTMELLKAPISFNINGTGSEQVPLFRIIFGDYEDFPWF